MSSGNHPMKQLGAARDGGRSTHFDCAAACTPFQDESITSTPSQEIEKSKFFLREQQELEDYVNELVPALQMVNKATQMNMMQDIYHRQEAFKLTADAVLARRAAGMAWGNALRERARGRASWSGGAFGEQSMLHAHEDDGDDGVSNYSYQAEGNNVDDANYIIEEMALQKNIREEEEEEEDEDEIWKSADVKCGSSSNCIGTPASMSSYYELELCSDHDFGDTLQHQGSTGSLATSEHSSMVDSTSGELSNLQQNHEMIDGGVVPLNHLVERMASCDSHKYVPQSAAHDDDDNDGDDDERVRVRVPLAGTGMDLYKEINARLVMIRGCCKDVDHNLDAAAQGAANNKNLSSQIMLGQLMGEGGGKDINGPSEVAQSTLDVVAPDLEAARQNIQFGNREFHVKRCYKGGGAAAVNMRSAAANVQREIIYREAAYKPIDWASIMRKEEEEVGRERPRRKNVRISEEPQSVAARRRRERISERIHILQHLVPGASKLDTASMLDEAIHYLKFLKMQVQALRRLEAQFYAPFNTTSTSSTHAPVATSAQYIHDMQLAAASLGFGSNPPPTHPDQRLPTSLIAGHPLPPPSTCSSSSSSTSAPSGPSPNFPPPAFRYIVPSPLRI